MEMVLRMNNKKIGIITLWDTMNYGAFLQAFSLFTFIKKNSSFEVSFIDFNKEIHHFISRRSLKKTINGYKLYKIYKSIKQSVFDFSSINESFDLVIIGSDELWNLNNDSFEHYREYFGENILCDNIISYAVSANEATIEQFNEFGRNPFKLFNNISVRDLSTKKIVDYYTNNNVPILLDPTFLLDDYKEWMIPFKYPSKYILIYGYSFSENEIKIIRKYASDNDCTIISAGIIHNWCDISYPFSPFEFLGAIEGSEYVVTSTFHGTVFSIILKKQFVSISRSNKISELLDMFQLNNNCCSNTDELVDKIGNVIDYSFVSKKIKSLKDISSKYLCDSLGELL